MKKFAAIIFDLDGVLVDSEPLHNKAWDTLFDELGLKDHLKINPADYIGFSDQYFLTEVFKKHNVPFTPEDLGQRKLNYLLRYLREHRPIFAELHSLVPDLAARYALGVASSSSHRVIDVVMDISGLGPHFQAIVGGDDIRRLKPDPEIYFTAARKLALRPSQCCAIEDSPVGIQAAKMAGMACIGLTSTLPAAELERADLIARNFGEVRAILLGDQVPVTK